MAHRCLVFSPMQQGPTLVGVGGSVLRVFGKVGLDGRPRLLVPAQVHQGDPPASARAALLDADTCQECIVASLIRVQP